MSELGEFLERFYSPAPMFRTVSARVRHIKKSAPSGGGRRRERALGRPRTGLASVIERQEELSMWASLPEQVRLEVTRIEEGGAESTLEVVNSQASWKRHADGTVERQDAERRRGRYWLPTEFQRHFGRELLRECFAALTLEPLGTCEAAGVRCLQVRAVKIPRAQLWPHWWAWDAAEFELAMHVERAALLSIVGLVNGERVETHEVLEVSYDEELDPALFTYEPSQQEVVQAAVPVTEHMTWEAAAKRVPFRLLRPQYLPESHQGMDEVMYHPSRPNSPEEHVTIFFGGHRAERSLWITERARRDRSHHERYEWESVSADGLAVEISDLGTEDGLRILTFEQDGTFVDITADLPRSELLKIASSMRAFSR